MDYTAASSTTELTQSNPTNGLVDFVLMLGCIASGCVVVLVSILLLEKITERCRRRSLQSLKMNRFTNLWRIKDHHNKTRF